MDQQQQFAHGNVHTTSKENVSAHQTNAHPDAEHVDRVELLYTIEEVPPWYLCIILGFQHYLTMFGSTITVPLVLAPHFCVAEDFVGLSWIISTCFFVSGLVTLIQTTVGVRLPIVQSATFAFLTPTIAILSLDRWKCPYSEKGADIDALIQNGTLPEYGSPEHREMWQSRLREIQGAIMLSSLFQIVIGFTGLIGFLLRFIGPLTVTPTVTLVGLSLFGAASGKSSSQWWIALMTIALMVIFSQYLRNIEFPLPSCGRKSETRMQTLPFFKLFPVILSILLAWLVCYILTITNTLSETEGEWGYNARTDIRSFVIDKAAWFRFPYPGQWGVPTISVAGVFGMLAGVLSSMMESIGDYYACARLSGAPPPPSHAVSRGIGVEGIGCLLAGAWGSGNGTTSYSENIGAIGITKVGSRAVIQVGAIIILLLSMLGKFGALFVTIPDPVVGGVFMVMFGMIVAVGLSNLQFVDLNSSRNLFILGFSIMFGISLPFWMVENPDAIQTGSEIVDQIVTVLCSTSMFIGGLVGFVLDNTIPGTLDERGILKWQTLSADSDSGVTLSCYDIPLIQKYLDRMRCTRYLPFCPSFNRGSTVADFPSHNGHDNVGITVDDDHVASTQL